MRPFLPNRQRNNILVNVVTVPVPDQHLAVTSTSTSTDARRVVPSQSPPATRVLARGSSQGGRPPRTEPLPEGDQRAAVAQLAKPSTPALRDSNATPSRFPTTTTSPSSSYALFLFILYSTTFAFVYEQINPGTTAHCQRALVQRFFSLSLPFKTLLGVGIAFAQSLVSMYLTLTTALVSVVAFSGRALERGIIMASHTTRAGVLSLASCAMRLGAGCVDAIIFRARVFKAIVGKVMLDAMSSEAVQRLLIFIGGVILGRAYERLKIRRSLVPVPASVRAECGVTRTGRREEDSVTLMQDDNDNDNAESDGEREGGGETEGGKPFRLRAVLSVIDFARLLTRLGDNEGERVGSPEPSPTPNHGQESDVVLVGPADRSTSDALVVPIEFGMTSPQPPSSAHSSSEPPDDDDEGLGSAEPPVATANGREDDLPELQASLLPDNRPARIEEGISPRPPSSTPVFDPEMNETTLGEGWELVDSDVAGVPGSFVPPQDMIRPRQPPSPGLSDEHDGNDVSQVEDDPMAELLMLIEETGVLSQPVPMPPTALLHLCPEVPVQSVVPPPPPPPPPGVTNNEGDVDLPGGLQDSPVSDCDVIVSLSRLSFRMSNDGDENDDGNGLPDSPIVDPRVDTGPLRWDSRASDLVGNGVDDDRDRDDDDVMGPPEEEEEGSEVVDAVIAPLSPPPPPPLQKSQERPEAEREWTRRRRAEATRELVAWRREMVRVLEVALEGRTRRAGRMDGSEESVGRGGKADDDDGVNPLPGQLLDAPVPACTSVPIEPSPPRDAPAPVSVHAQQDTPAPAPTPIELQIPPSLVGVWAPAQSSGPIPIVSPRRPKRRRRHPKPDDAAAAARKEKKRTWRNLKRQERKRRCREMGWLFGTSGVVVQQGGGAKGKGKAEEGKGKAEEKEEEKIEAGGGGVQVCEDVGDASMLEVQERLLGANTSVVANIAHGFEAGDCDVEAVVQEHLLGTDTPVDLTNPLDDPYWRTGRSEGNMSFITNPSDEGGDEDADDASMFGVQEHLFGTNPSVDLIDPSDDPYWRTRRSEGNMSFITNPSDEGGEGFEYSTLSDWDGGSAVGDEEPLLGAGPSVTGDPSDGRYWRMGTEDGGRAFVADPVYKSGFGYPALSDWGGGYVGREPPQAESTPVVNDPSDDAYWQAERAEVTLRGISPGPEYPMLSSGEGNAGRPPVPPQWEWARLQAPIPASVPIERSPAHNAPARPPVPPNAINLSNGRRWRRRRRPGLEYALAAAWKDRRRTRQNKRRQERNRKYTGWVPGCGIRGNVVVASASEEGVFRVGRVRGGLGSEVVSDTERDDMSLFGTEVATSVSSAVMNMSGDEDDLESQSGASTSFLTNISVEYGGEDTPPIRADRYLGRGARFAARYAQGADDDDDGVEGGAGVLRADWRSRALTELWVTEHAWRV